MFTLSAVGQSTLWPHSAEKMQKNNELTSPIPHLMTLAHPLAFICFYTNTDIHLFSCCILYMYTYLALVTPGSKQDPTESSCPRDPSLLGT